jgi:hypothetical protein
MTFTFNHPNYYKKLKPKQTGSFFGKKVTIDTSKDLEDQLWFKSDLFGEREKDAIKTAWKQPGIKSTQRITEIKDITKEELDKNNE